MTTWSARSCPAATSPARLTSTPSWPVAGGGEHPAQRVLGCAPADRIAADKQAMLALPPVPPVTGWRQSARLARDHYIRLDSNDYSVHPAVIGRRIEVTADLDRVTVRVRGPGGRQPRAGLGVAPDHHRPRPPGRGQGAGRDRVTLFRPPREAEVQVRCLADYDAALGTGSSDGSVA